MNKDKSSENDTLKIVNDSKHCISDQHENTDDRDKTIKDIVSTFKHSKVYGEFKELLDDLSKFDFGRSGVNSPAAFGDTYKYTVEYTIGGFQFKYHHVLPEGEISSAKWSVTYKTKKETLFKYSYMDSMRLRFFKSTKLPTEPPTVYPLNTTIFDKFKLKYIFAKDDNYYLFFNILNAFTNGNCMGIRSVDGSATAIYHQQLCDMIDIEKY
uniref:Uncharacterized protein n=1 Tax=Pithovirus LCPAC202 TaxID=2506592 RepID=A0A481Z5D2_9VIRU|nr:MAG: hypothetical protein LCPAC202_00420 [Pithovirus LCPAC202]